MSLKIEGLSLNGVTGKDEVIDIPSNVMIITPNAFSNLSFIKEVHFNDGLRYIGPSAFENCNGLTEITIIGDIGTIYENAFKGCKNLSKVNIPDGSPIILDGAFEGCDKLFTINIPHRCSILSKTAFNDCPLLKEEMIDEISPLPLDNTDEDDEEFDFDAYESMKAITGLED